MDCLRRRREMCLQEKYWTAGLTKCAQKVPPSEIDLSIGLGEHLVLPQ